MFVLIGFEESQEVCKSFRDLGYEAYSCDLQDCSGGYPQWHFKMDIFKAINLVKWDLIILHPPCTYTAVCGNRWYWDKQERIEGIKFCKDIWDAACSVCDHVALEQPKTIMQRYIGRKSQVIHPWQFGHGETKETWLWLKNLPLLKPTNIVEGRENRIWKMPPSKDRQKLRSKTYPGIAASFAMQWGNIHLIKRDEKNDTNSNYNNVLFASDSSSGRNNSVAIFESEGINPYEDLIRAVVMVESTNGKNIYNEKENAVGHFQIRQIRVDHYNKLLGTNYVLTDFYDYDLSRAMFLYYASGKSYEVAARNWNGKWSLTEDYWKRVKKHLP